MQLLLKYRSARPAPARIALCAAIMLFVASPAGAGAEVLAPHPVAPDQVTPHVVSPASEEPSSGVAAGEPGTSAESPSSGDLDTGGDMYAPVEPGVGPSAGRPAVDVKKHDVPGGGSPGTKNPSGGCKPKPGTVCPYYCLKDGTGCEPLSIQYVGAYYQPLEDLLLDRMQMSHLCAAATEVTYRYRLYEELAEAFGITSKLPYIFRKTSLDLARMEAEQWLKTYDCITLVER
jgi:hypothetical protein